MKPTNTTRQVKNDPTLMAAEMMLGGTSSAIENQEAKGQKELVNSTVLPTDGLGCEGKPNSLFEIIKLNGGSVGEKVEGDEMFTNVVLPESWTKKGTDHSMHSELLDDKGRKRAGIFYKAASYDRSANISAFKRFNVKKDYDDETNATYQVEADNGVIFRSSHHFEGEKYEDSWRAADDAAMKEANDWLSENYPGHDDLLKCWDIEIKA